MKNLSRLVVTLAACAVSIAAFAQSASGNWNGKIDVSGVKAAKPDQQGMVNMMKQQAAMMTMKLNMKADHTYNITISMGKGQSFNEGGKWSQTGRTVTMTDKKGKSQKLSMSANGKQMTMTPSGNDNGPKGMKIIFSR